MKVIYHRKAKVFKLRKLTLFKLHHGRGKFKMRTSKVEYKGKTTSSCSTDMCRVDTLFWIRCR